MVRFYKQIINAQNINKELKIIECEQIIMQPELILNIKSTNNINGIFHLSIDELIKIKKIDYTSKDLLKKYEFLQSEDFKFAIQFIGNLFKRYCLNEINENELIAQFPQLSAAQHKIILSILTARKSEITNYLIKSHNSQAGQVVDSFDWNVKWVMGNSSMSTMRTQLATLILNTQDSSGDVKKLFFELDKNKLNEFIKVLTECKEKLESAKL